MNIQIIGTDYRKRKINKIIQSLLDNTLGRILSRCQAETNLVVIDGFKNFGDGRIRNQSRLWKNIGGRLVGISAFRPQKRVLSFWFLSD